jgi:hypothetical protein
VQSDNSLTMAKQHHMQHSDVQGTDKTGATDETRQSTQLDAQAHV